MADNYFKKYKREQRVQNMEERFDAGMQFTNAPLKQGACRLPINYDIKNGGEVLVPRPAIITSNISGVGAVGEYSLALNGKTSTESNATYEQVLVGNATNNPVANSELFQGNITPLTIDPSDTELFLVQRNGASKPSTYKRPVSASIHDMKLSDTSPMASNVGTFGFNNSYYCFNPTNKKLMQTKITVDKFEFEELNHKSLNPKEAVSWGYNMLNPTPYQFVDGVSPGAINLLGLLPYRPDGSLALNMKVNETALLRCYYSGPTENTYKVLWEWKEVTGTDWTKIKEETIALTSTPQIKTNFSFPSERVLIRISFTLGTETIPEQILTVGFDLTSDESSTTNLKPEIYDLSTATGMTYWKNRLIVYGVRKDKSILFSSDVNDPTYFPYPHGADIFDEPIVYVLPFLDNLLVFTSSQLYMLYLDPSGAGWVKKHIQSNLSIKEWDIHLIRQVKNMVFFKSGNYFYMVVPSLKTTTFGELVVTPISRNIEYLLDNFKPTIDSFVQLLYNYNSGLELVHYYNFLDYEDVHNVYTFQTNTNYLNVVLLYNTVSRAWRIHVFESDNIVKPYEQDTTKKGTLMSVINGGIQFLKYDTSSAKDFYYRYLGDYIPVSPRFKNYQMLDTGYRDIDTDYNKRYREFQVKFHNISQKTLNFATEFFIDGELRQNMYDYKVVHITDPSDPNYLSIVVEREMSASIELPGATVLAENENDVRAWSLDVSMFPDLFLWKIRVPVSGKGLSPRMRLISFNEELFEILNVTWVYRKLYSR